MFNCGIAICVWVCECMRLCVCSYLHDCRKGRSLPWERHVYNCSSCSYHLFGATGPYCFYVNKNLPICLIQHAFLFFQAKNKYEKAFKDAEKSLDNYRKADADINLSRAEVEKVSICLEFKMLVFML